MVFDHVELDLKPLEREHIDGVRYYKIPDEDELIKMVSITSVTSHFNKDIFVKWRKRVGNEEADRITKAATGRGTDMHTLTEHYLRMKIYLKDYVLFLIFYLRSLRGILIK